MPESASQGGCLVWGWCVWSRGVWSGGFWLGGCVWLGGGVPGLGRGVSGLGGVSGPGVVCLVQGEGVVCLVQGEGVVCLVWGGGVSGPGGCVPGLGGWCVWSRGCVWSGAVCLSALWDTTPPGPGTQPPL